MQTQTSSLSFSTWTRAASASAASFSAFAAASAAYPKTDSQIEKVSPEVSACSMPRTGRGTTPQHVENLCSLGICLGFRSLCFSLCSCRCLCIATGSSLHSQTSITGASKDHNIRGVSPAQVVSVPHLLSSVPPLLPSEPPLLLVVPLLLLPVPNYQTNRVNLRLEEIRLFETQV